LTGRPGHPTIQGMSRREPNDSDTFPRAPSQAAWDAMSPEERARVVDSLPGWLTDAEMSPPEGDEHFQAKVSALETLRGYFSRQQRRIYLAAELAVYYPDERRFAPDLLAVLDVEVHNRTRWVVSDEGKGLDFVLEVHVGGDRKKDAEDNVVRYARLGIPEYFIYDRARQQLLGYRLPSPDARVYKPIVPQHGRYASHLLGLELQLEDDRLRFYSGTALLLESQELIIRLEDMVDQLQRRVDEEARSRAEEARLRQEAEQRQREAERRAAELLAELERLKGRR